MPNITQPIFNFFFKLFNLFLDQRGLLAHKQRRKPISSLLQADRRAQSVGHFQADPVACNQRPPRLRLESKRGRSGRQLPAQNRNNQRAARQLHRRRTNQPEQSRNRAQRSDHRLANKRRTRRDRRRLHTQVCQCDLQRYGRVRVLQQENLVQERVSLRLLRLHNPHQVLRENDR